MVRFSMARIACWEAGQSITGRDISHRLAFLLAMLPPGAFIGLGLMLAVKYLIDEKMKKRRAETAPSAVPAGETGKV